MKKIFLFLALAFLLIGCGSKDDNNNHDDLVKEIIQEFEKNTSLTDEELSKDLQNELENLFNDILNDIDRND